MNERAPCGLYLGTEDGLREATLHDYGLEIVGRALDGEAVRAIDVDPGSPRSAFVGCGLRGSGLYRVERGTARELGFADEWVWGLARDPTDPDELYVGTEPPMVYVSTDGGATFEAFDAIDELPSRPRWTFFHDPFEAGHVHGFAIHPDRPERLFAGVEHGALIYTHDGGETWHEALVGEDLHRVAVDPSDPDRVFAATGSGLRRSDDAGATWKRIDDLAGSYLHAIVFDPTNPARMYVYADREGNPLYASTDGGASWTAIGEGLPAANPADTLRLHPHDPGTLIYVGDPEGGSSRVFVCTEFGDDVPDDPEWTQFGPDLPKVWRLEVAPGIDSTTGDPGA